MWCVRVFCYKLAIGFGKIKTEILVLNMTIFVQQLKILKLVYKERSMKVLFNVFARDDNVIQCPQAIKIPDKKGIKIGI